MVRYKFLVALTAISMTLAGHGSSAAQVQTATTEIVVQLHVEHFLQGHTVVENILFADAAACANAVTAYTMNYNATLAGAKTAFVAFCIPNVLKTKL